MSALDVRAPNRAVAGLFALIVMLCAAAAHAQSRLPLSIEVQQASNVSRTTGPIRLQLKLEWGGPGVLRGDLLLEARDAERELLGVFHVPNLYLTEGVQVQEIMLPGFRIFSSVDAITLAPTLLEADSGRRHELRPLQVLVPGGEKRELVIAICVPEAAIIRRRENDLVHVLRLENLAPAQGNPPRLLTKSVDWPAEDAPQEPLRYCACDILLLPDDGLAVFQQPQLDALLAWVRAGGALCVLTGDESLNAAQLEFLNTLCGAEEEDPLFLRDSSGRLIYGAAESPDAPQRHTVGLGRAAVIVGRDLAHPRAEHWRQTSAFLWRVRQGHLSSIAEGGAWDQAQLTEAAKAELYRYGSGLAEMPDAITRQAADLQPQVPSGMTGLLLRLMPGGVQMVPLGAIGALLLGYLLAIGPADYFVLGKLGLRRWTWATFPLMTVAFTAFSIGLSNSYMSTADTRRSAIIRDVVEGGLLARENRLELLFPSTSREIETDVGRGLFMPTRHQDFGQLSTRYYDPTMYDMSRHKRADPALYAGRMPVQCDIRQRVAQWTPQLNRILTIPLAVPDDLPPFDWDEVPDFETPAGKQRLRERIEAAFGRSASAAVFRGGDDAARSVTGDHSWFLANSVGQQLVYRGGTYAYVNDRKDFLRSLSLADQPGLMTIVRQLSPTGGDRFEDLVLLDPSDPRQWLLVIVQPHGDDFLIYRRVYVLND